MVFEAEHRRTDVLPEGTMSRSRMSRRLVRQVPRRVWRHGLLVALFVPLAATEAWAGCPRRTREQVRRLVPAVLFWPSAPFILRARPATAAMPAVGAPARVSHHGPEGDVHFTEGRFVRHDSSAVTLSGKDGREVRVPLADVVCLQTPRRAASAGAGNGFVLGVLGGLSATVAVSALESDPGERRETLSFGTFVLTGFGAMGGTIVGAAIRGTTWDTVLDRSR